MNDSMLMQAASRRAELTREAGQSRLAARLRRPRPTSRVRQVQSKPKPRAKTPSRPPRPDSWLTTAIARLWPTTKGRWQAQ
jgi:hypothetical protein